MNKMLQFYRLDILLCVICLCNLHLNRSIPIVRSLACLVALDAVCGGGQSNCTLVVVSGVDTHSCQSSGRFDGGLADLECADWCVLV